MSNKIILKSYQKEAVNFLNKNDFNFLVAETGTGKTIMALSYCINLLNSKKVNKSIIFTTLSNIKNFLVDFQKLENNNYKICNFNKNNEKIDFEKNDIIILNYEKAEKLIDYLDISTTYNLILDEASKIKNYTSKRFKNLYKIRNKVNCKAISVATATPFSENILDSYSLIKIVHNNNLNYFKFFDENYFKVNDYYNYNKALLVTFKENNGKLRTYAPLKNYFENLKKLMQPIFVVKKQQIEDVHEQEIIKIDFNFNEKQNFFLEKFNKNFDVYNDEIEVFDNIFYYNKKMNNLVKNSKNKQIEAGFLKLSLKNLKIKDNNLIENITKINNLSIINNNDVYYFFNEEKLLKMKEIIGNNLKLKTDILRKKVIIFTEYIEMSKNIFKYLSKFYKCVRIDGSLEIDNKNQILNDFQNNYEIDVLISVTASIAHGVNLTASNLIIFNDLPYSTEIFYQGCNRINRISQCDLNFVYYFNYNDNNKTILKFDELVKNIKKLETSVKVEAEAEAEKIEVEAEVEAEKIEVKVEAKAEAEKIEAEAEVEAEAKKIAIEEKYLIEYISYFFIKNNIKFFKEDVFLCLFLFKVYFYLNDKKFKLFVEIKLGISKYGFYGFEIINKKFNFIKINYDYVKFLDLSNSEYKVFEKQDFFNKIINLYLINKEELKRESSYERMYNYNADLRLNKFVYELDYNFFMQNYPLFFKDLI